MEEKYDFIKGCVVCEDFKTKTKTEESLNSGKKKGSSGTSLWTWKRGFWGVCLSVFTLSFPKTRCSEMCQIQCCGNCSSHGHPQRWATWEMGMSIAELVFQMLPCWSNTSAL